MHACFYVAFGYASRTEITSKNSIMLHLWEKGQRKTNKDMDEDKDTAAKSTDLRTALDTMRD